MTRTRQVKIGFAVAAVATSFGIVSSSQARYPGEPGGGVKQVRVSSAPAPGGYSCCSGVHVKSPAEARTE